MDAQKNPIEFDLQEILTENRISGIWRLLRGFRLTYVGAALSLGIAAACRTGIYLMLGYFVDDVLVRANYKNILPFIALSFIGLAALQGVFSFLSGRMAAKTAESIARRLRNYLYDHIQRLPFSYHDVTNTGELIQRTTSDVDAMRRFFQDQAIGLGRILLMFIVNLAGLLIINVKLALLSIIVVPVTILLSYFFFERVSRAYEAYQEQEATLSSTLQENLTGVRVVKAFARQAYERIKFDRENWEKYLRGRRLLTMHAFYWPISDILTGGQMLAGYLIGALMAIAGEISVGDYLSYAGMIIWIIWPIRNLGRLIVHMSTGMVSFNRITTIIQQTQEQLTEGDHQPAATIRGQVEFRDVSFRYDDESPVLKGINFVCSPGQVIALLGSTGSGKTSLVNLLPRFYEYTGGSILLDGVELKRYSRKFLRSQIGIVEQEPFLFSRTIRENIVYGTHTEVTEDEIRAATKAAALHDVILDFPNGYDTLVGEKGVTLSGGQKQRVAIARTLLRDPTILILDDATSSVDPETEGEIRRALNNLMKGRTTFIIAHRIQSVMGADTILVLDQGAVVQMGTHAELMRVDGMYRRIFEIQTRIEEELEKEMAIAGVNA